MMESNCKNVTERILQLTLEIIYLLTGEDNIVVIKTSGDAKNAIMIPLHFLLVASRNNEEKILDVTKKITELLTRESGNWNNFNVSIKQEIKEEEEELSVMEKECLKEHKNLYKDVMMDNQPPLTSPDGSRDPPERCPRPLDSQDSTQEGHTVPHHHQGEDLMLNTDASSNRNPPERCPHPPQHFTQEDHTTPHHHQGEEVMGIKIVVKEEEEETYVMGNQLCIKDEIIETIIKEESSLDDSAGGHNDIKAPGAHLTVPAGHNKNENPFIKKNDLVIRRKIHTSERPYLCSECEKAFKKKSKLIEHMRIHTGEKPFSCSECGKAFTQKSLLKTHQRVHTGEKPYPCPVCGKCFCTNGNRTTHMRIHTGEKPYSCSKCGRCFSDKWNCNKHMRTHIGEKLLSCPECGKCFKKKVELVIHQNTHTATAAATTTTLGH